MSAAKGASELEQALENVWRQALVDGAKNVTVGQRSYPVRRTAKRSLCQVDFDFEGEAIRGLEQNPNTQSRWAQMARDGAKIMQFLRGGRYIGNVADGKVTLYPAARAGGAGTKPKGSR